MWKDVKKMNNFKIGDRVKVSSMATSYETGNPKITIGMIGTVKRLDGAFVGVEFDDDVCGHHARWAGKQGYCWYILHEELEKIDEMDTEGKAKTFEQKVLKALREEIGVDVGEEFDVYENGERQGTYKFDRNEFGHKIGGKFHKLGVWIDIICDFYNYTFKRKPFIPKYKEDYFFLTVSRDENISLKRGRKTWTDDGVDYGMLALGNVFRSEEEALASKDKLLERLKKLQNGE